MREICQSGSEGGASQTNGTFLPLSHFVVQHPVPPRCLGIDAVRRTGG